MKKKLIIFLCVFVVIVVGIILTGIGIKSTTETNLKNLTNLTISNVDLTKLADGIYTGSYKEFPITAEVRVTVVSHKITEIQLVKHEHGQGFSAEVILERVVEAQNLDVDTVSGATYSSKVILKAIENALNTTNK